MSLIERRDLNVLTEGWEKGKSRRKAFPSAAVHADNYSGVERSVELESLLCLLCSKASCCY